MEVFATPDQLQKAIGNQTYFRCGFVPTMGALHEGHLALIRRAARYHDAPRREARRGASWYQPPVVVSIFVNPTQFGPGEDFEKYPRNLEADIEAAASAGAQIVFTPDVETIYPGGSDTPVPTLPPVATEPGLEDAHRPGHFAGVCQVVARLFDLVKPGYAVFGEKDYQQLLVIEAMVQMHSERWPELTTIRHPTVRDADGLALSSRNRYLSDEQRERALGLSRALGAARGASGVADGETRMREVLEKHDLQIDYAVIRDSATLMPIDSLEKPARALIAARVDDVRLIDNSEFTIETQRAPGEI